MRSIQKIAAISFAVFLNTALFAQKENALLIASNKSYELEKHKNYFGAADVLKAVNTSTSYITNLRLGWLSYLIGQNALSLTYYENAIKLAPNSIEAKIGYIYPAYISEQTDKVILQYKNILALDPKNVQALYNLGTIYYYLNDFKNAVGYFGKFNELYPFDYGGLSMLAWTNLKLDNKEVSKGYFEKVLLNTPGDRSSIEGLTHLNMGFSPDDKLYNAFARNYEMCAMRDYKGAIDALKEVYDKNSYELNLRLGWLYYTLGSHKEAIEYYKIAATMKPNAIEPKLWIVYPLGILANKNELVEQYLSILAIDPQNSIANYRLGYIKYEDKDYATSAGYFEKVVALYPAGHDGLLMLAWSYLKAGKTKEAKKTFNDVLLISPNDKSALEGLALIK